MLIILSPDLPPALALASSWLAGRAFGIFSLFCDGIY